MAEFKLKQTAEEVQKAIDDASIPSDWNQTDSSAADFIKNKPFGEGYGDTLTIEAIDPDNFDSSTLVGEMFLKVCDTPVTMNDLANGYAIRFGPDTIEVPPEAVGESAVQFADGITLISESFLSVEEQGVGVEIDGIVFAESGIYLNAYMLLSDIDITVPGFGKFAGIQKLDEKYIPSIPARKLPANAINVQPDWNQTDETAMDFIRNKPVIEKLRLYTVTRNSVEYIVDTFGGEPLTAEQFATHIVGYTADKILVENNLCVGLIHVNSSYYSIAYFDCNVNGTFSVYHAYTAEYTGS